MSEITSNDAAFIKISREVKMLENSITVGDKLKEFLQRLTYQSSGYMLKGFSDIDCDVTCVPEVEGFMPLVRVLKRESEHISNKQRGATAASQDSTTMDSFLDKARERLVKLKRLQEVYLRGEDIVEARLRLDN